VLFGVGAVLTDLNRTTASEPTIKPDYERLPPSDDLQPGEIPPVILVPLLIAPTEESEYLEHPVDLSLESTAKPIARLSKIESVQNMWVREADKPEFTDPEAISFLVYYTIRYQLNDGTVYLSTSTPSPVALEKNLGFGGEVAHLDNGLEVWLDANIDSDVTPNTVSFIDDDLIITLAGDLSMERLQELAAQVVIER
jgi:hypothetical protein